MTYDEIVAQLMTMLEVPLNQSDTNFTRILPAMFNHAEGRIWGDLNFLVTDITQPVQLTANAREFALPDSVIILEQIAVCTPVGAITNASKRVTLERISPVALDMFWPQANFKPGVPQKYAVLGNRVPSSQTLVMNPGDMSQTLTVVPEQLSYIVRLMPTPDKAYMAELTGTIHPEVISPTNPKTFLSTRYPELLLAACMVFGSGYQRDFGAQADDPTRAVSWDAQYKALLQGIMVEHARMRGEGPGFTSQPPAPVAQLPRAP